MATIPNNILIPEKTPNAIIIAFSARREFCFELEIHMDIVKRLLHHPLDLLLEFLMPLWNIILLAIIGDQDIHRGLEVQHLNGHQLLDLDGISNTSSALRIVPFLDFLQLDLDAHLLEQRDQTGGEAVQWGGFADVGAALDDEWGLNRKHGRDWDQALKHESAAGACVRRDFCDVWD
jgi:hypothetical protein